MDCRDHGSQRVRHIWVTFTFTFHSDAVKDWRQEEKWVTEDEMVGWHHWLNGHEIEQTPGDGKGQGSLACCSPWACKDLGMTKWLNYFKFLFQLCQLSSQVLKDDAVKVLQSICLQIWKTEQWPQGWKRSVFIPIPKKGNAKQCSDYYTNALMSHFSKVMLKILQVRLHQDVNLELPDVQAGFKKDRGTRDQIANIRWIIKKAWKFQENIYFCFIDHTKVFDLRGSLLTVQNSSGDGNSRPSDLLPEKSVCRSRSNS